MNKGNLVYQVYFATFDKPRYKSEIGELLYGKETPTQNYPTLIGKDKAIEKCIKLGLIKEEKSIKMPGDGSTTSYHFKKRDYYTANPNILLDGIKNKLVDSKISGLSNDEEKILEYFFNHDSFKKFIGATLFREENGKIIYLKEHATLESIIQYLTVISSYTNVSIKTSGKKIINKNFDEFKIRFNKALKDGEKLKYPGLKRSKSDALKKIYIKCQEGIEKKISDKMFSESESSVDKAVNKLSDIHFFEAFVMLGSELLDKLARVSILNDWIKIIHISSATTSILQTYIHYRVNMPQPTRGIQVKDEGSPLIGPIKNILKEFKNKAESI